MKKVKKNSQIFRRKRPVSPPPRWTVVYLGAGSNETPRLGFLKKAWEEIGRSDFFKRRRSASIYETDPVGPVKQKSFFNTVWEVATTLPPRLLLQELKKIEKIVGRKKTRRWGPRALDLDILYYGKTGRSVRGPGLSIPHPHLHQRRFVLVPLNEVAPRLRHPVLKATPAQLLRQLTPHGQRVTIRLPCHTPSFPFRIRKP